MTRFMTRFVLLLACVCLLWGSAAADTGKQATTNFQSPKIDSVVVKDSKGKDHKVPAGIGIADREKFPRIKIFNLGPNVNSPKRDYAPAVTQYEDFIYFVSDRDGSQLLPNGKRASDDFWFIKKARGTDTTFLGWAVATLDETVDNGDHTSTNTQLNEGVLATTANGKMLAISGCKRPDGLGDCDIYMVHMDWEKTGKPIDKPRNMRSINSEYFDSQPSIAPGGEKIYFTSTRKGPNSDGKNTASEMDIWVAEGWDEMEEDFKIVRNLEEINSPGVDCSPWISPDGKHLIFSSDRSGGYGGLDFYVSKFDDASKKWGTPVNLGKPINTSDDDQFMTMNGDLTAIYFSSRRTDVDGYQGDLDLYMAVVPMYPRTVLLHGVIVDECSGEPIVSQVSITNRLTGKKIDNVYSEAKMDFTYVVKEEDFISGNNTADSITLDIVSVHPKLGKESVTTVVRHNDWVDDPDLSQKHADTLEFRIPMGDRPTLTPVIAEADYIEKAKTRKPELAKWRGLVMAEEQTYNLYPLLTYVFFDEGSSEWEPRYHRFKNPSDTRVFTDTTIAGKTLDKYYHILNIFGFRLTQHPEQKIKVIGNTDNLNPSEKVAGLSKARAEKVYNYLKDVWKISPDRMEIVIRDFPASPSNNKDTLGQIENRRVELVSDEWEIFKPVFEKSVSRVPQPDEMSFTMKNGMEDDVIASRKIVIKHGNEEWKVLTGIGINDPSVVWDWMNEDGDYPVDTLPFTAQLFITTKTGAICSSEPVVIPVKQVSTEERLVATGEGKTKEDYSLILFPFGSAEAGPVNERVMNDYVYGRIFRTSDIDVTGHTDVVGLFETNVKLSQRRAATVRSGIQKSSGGKYKSMDVSGVGPENPLYPNDIPEGRFYNRTVNVKIESTITPEILEEERIKAERKAAGLPTK